MTKNLDEKWLEFYRRSNNIRYFFSDKAWETIKLHILLSSSLISVTIGALALMHTSGDYLALDKVMRFILVLLLVFLPVSMLLIVYQGSTNFVRECKRMYEQISIIMKLEEKLGLDGERTERKQFPKDDKYVPKRYDEIWNDSNQFIKDMMSRKDTLYSNMFPIFRIFEGASFALIFSVIGVAILHMIL